MSTVEEANEFSRSSHGPLADIDSASLADETAISDNMDTSREVEWTENEMSIQEELECQPLDQEVYVHAGFQMSGRNGAQDASMGDLEGE